MHVRKTGVDFAPLLEGNIQFGKMGATHENLATNELRPRNVAIILTDGVRMLDAKIKEIEHPGWIDLEKDKNCEQKHRLEFFSTRFLTVQQWDEDHVLSSNSS